MANALAPELQLVTYSSWDEVPNDYETMDEIVAALGPHALDGNDSTVARGPQSEKLANLARSLATAELRPPPPKGLIVPYRGIVKLGSKGTHAQAYNRALARAGLMSWPKARSKLVFDKWSVTALKKFQKARKIKVDGVGGAATHRKLTRYFLGWEGHLYGAAPWEAKGRIAMEQKILSLASFLYNNRVVIHYTRGPLRMYGLRYHLKPPAVTRWEDCSSLFKYMAWYSGMPSPDKLGYRSYLGYTGTMIQAGTVVRDRDRIRIGDAIFYGRGSAPNHVAMALTAEATKVISHGSEAGPLILPSTYRSDRHSRYPAITYRK